MDRETPRSVMFDDLRKFGVITNRDTAWMLLRSTPKAGGKAPRDRVDERTFLSREVVHAPVERPRPELFADITQTAQNITARLISNLGGNEMARAMVAEHYSGEAADAMRESLSAYGLDDRIYRNADRVVFMDGGRIVEEGPAEQVIDHPREQRTREFLSRIEG